MKGYYPLPQRSRFLLTGTDRVRYLNGQVTNQIAELPGDLARYACVTNRKGQLEADLYVTNWPDREALMIESHLSLREPLAERLDRYIIADDATLTDVTEDGWQTIHLLDADLPDGSCHAFHANRFGIPGWDILLEPGADLDSAVKKHEWPRLTDADVTTLRIEQLIAAWGHELKTGILPPEARLQERAIDYHKGCYTGQEVISRMRSSGKVNRLLARFTAPTLLPQESLIWAADSSSKPVGEITTAILAGTGPECLALGFLKTDYFTNNIELIAKPPGTTDRFPLTIHPSSLTNS